MVHIPLLEGLSTENKWPRVLFHACSKSVPVFHRCIPVDIGCYAEFAQAFVTFVSDNSVLRRVIAGVMASKEIIMGLCLLAFGTTHGYIWFTVMHVDIIGDQWIGVYPVTNYWYVRLFVCLFIFYCSHCTTVIGHEDSVGREASERKDIFVLQITGNAWVVTSTVSTEVKPVGINLKSAVTHPIVTAERQNRFRHLLSELFDLWFGQIDSGDYMSHSRTVPLHGDVWAFLIHLPFKWNADTWRNYFAYCLVLYI